MGSIFPINWTNEDKLHWECPQCHHPFDVDEIEKQECDYCGWGWKEEKPGECKKVKIEIEIAE